MQKLPQHLKRALCVFFFLTAACARAEENEIAPPTEVIISIADQKLAVLRDGGLVAKYKISTSRFGVGDSFGSYQTPLGRMRVCEKIGGQLSAGAVIKNRSATGEVIPVNARGRDPIVTRILWLDGLEAQNRNARVRGIYIHGTPEEKMIGKPVSWGCIRMRSSDVMEIYDDIAVGTPVSIIPERLPRLHKYEPPKPVVIASIVAPPAPPPPAPAPAPEKARPRVAALPPVKKTETASVRPAARKVERLSVIGEEPTVDAKPSHRISSSVMSNSILYSDLQESDAGTIRKSSASAEPHPVSQTAPPADVPAQTGGFKLQLGTR